MKFKAPENCTGISVGGEQFNVDEKGHIEVPDNGDYHALLAPHGFTLVLGEVKAKPPVDPNANSEAETAAAEAAAQKAAQKNKSK